MLKITQHLSPSSSKIPAASWLALVEVRHEGAQGKFYLMPMYLRARTRSDRPYTGDRT